MFTKLFILLLSLMFGDPRLLRCVLASSSEGILLPYRYVRSQTIVTIRAAAKSCVSACLLILLRNLANHTAPLVILFQCVKPVVPVAADSDMLISVRPR